MKRTTFDFLVRLTRGTGEPIRAQVVRELRRAVQDGRLPPGSLLPASRALANDLGFSRGLIVEAYEQLVAEGYFTARGGSSTRVTSNRSTIALRDNSRTRARVIAPAAAPIRYDFRPGVPDLSLFPSRAWSRALRHALGAGSRTTLDYPDPRGAAQARNAVALYLNRSRATIAIAERVMLCTGFAQAARLVGEVLARRGVRRIAVEDPGHAEQCADIRAAGLELVALPVDGRGARVDRLNDLDVGAVLVTPAHQYPTGAVLDPARRSRLLEWASRRGAFILEDDYDAEYRYDRSPVGALQGLAPDRVVYIGSASKMLAPSLRLGWLVLPADLVDDVARAKLSADRGSPSLEQLALAAFLDGGDLDRHVRRTRAIYRDRRDALVDSLRKHLPDLDTRGVAAGLHLFLELPRRITENALVKVAAAQGVRIFGGRAYHIDWRAPPPALILGYGCLPERDIDPGVKVLARLIQGATR
jgi:GntR family transcriptional regulator/MocR family aminotransferase